MFSLIKNKKIEEKKDNQNYLIYHDFNIDIDLSNITINQNIKPKKEEIAIRKIKRII